MERVKGLPIIIDGNAKALILGSMPGAESRKQRQYYANKQNHFWTILFTLFGSVLPVDISYIEKITFLKNQKLALWDVIETCKQKKDGSSDSTIGQEQVNDFVQVFHDYLAIQYVFFNGAKAYETFRKRIGFEKFPAITFIKLTSTSPANAIGLAKKLVDWEAIKVSIR